MKTSEIVKDVVSCCAGVRVLSSARAITRHYDTALRPVGLTITQFTLLVGIDAIKPTSISQIGDWLSIERTSVTRNLKPLEARGLIERGPEGAARMRPVNLTKAGREELKRAYPLWQSAQAEVEGLFTKSGFQEAMDVLGTLRMVDKKFASLSGQS